MKTVTFFSTFPLFNECLQGLNTYLDRHKYSNTITNDLWAALEESSGKGVKAMMDSWTTQMGYPLITVSNPPGTYACSTAVCMEQ